MWPLLGVPEEGYSPTQSVEVGEAMPDQVAVSAEPLATGEGDSATVADAADAGDANKTKAATVANPTSNAPRPARRKRLRATCDITDVVLSPTPVRLPSLGGTVHAADQSLELPSITTR